MPNRIIKESINESKGLSECSIFAQDLFKRLVTYADDYGRFNADTEIMRARLYPRELSAVTQDDMISALVELGGVGKIQFYTSVPKKEVYGCFPNWKDHQRIRDSKKNCPEPSDTAINDWYLRRFVSIDMKAEIIERDGFKCKICGKFLTSCRDAKRFAKLGGGLYHIDHIVPCQQGGRATLENLRLTCPECNLSRKKLFTFEEILQFAFSPDIAESCGEFPQNAESLSRNPIQSESNSESESKYMPGAETPPDPQPEEPPVISLPLNDGTEYAVTDQQVNEWGQLYPAVNIMQALRNMKGWLIGHPNNLKTRRGILKFITGWLARDQDSARPGQSRNQAHATFADLE